MKIKELKEKLFADRGCCCTIYAPAEGYENRYYKLGLNEYEFKDDDVLGYECIDKDWCRDLNIIIDTPVDFTKVTITAHFINGRKFEISSPVHLQVELVELYEFWPSHIDCRTGKEWNEAAQLTIEESSSGSEGK